MKKDFRYIKSKVVHKGKNKKLSKEIKDFKSSAGTKAAEAPGLTPKQHAEDKKAEQDIPQSAP